MEERYKYALLAAVVLAALLYFYRGGNKEPTRAPAGTSARVTETWPPERPATSRPTTYPTTYPPTTPPAATTERPIVGVGAESPSYVAPIKKQSAADGIRDAAFDEVASTLLSASRVVDERISPVISSKNGGLLPNLDVRGDYDAMMCGNEQLADDCGCWNRSSAQRGIKLGYIKDTDRRRVVLAGP